MEGTDGERGEGWVREEGETGNRSLRGQRKEGNEVAQVQRRVLSCPFSTAWNLLTAAQLAPVYVVLWYHLVARVIVNMIECNQRC